MGLEALSALRRAEFFMWVRVIALVFTLLVVHN